MYNESYIAINIAITAFMEQLGIQTVLINTDMTIQRNTLKILLTRPADPQEKKKDKITIVSAMTSQSVSYKLFQHQIRL